MEKREVVRALLWAAVAFFAWQMIAGRIWPSEQAPEGRGPPRFTQGRDFGRGEGVADPLEVGATSPGMEASESPAGGVGAIAADPQTLVIGDRQGQQAGGYGLRLVLTNVGASVVSAELSDYTLSVKEDSPPYPLLAEAFSPDGETYYSYATNKVHFRDRDLDLATDHIPWSVETVLADKVVFVLDIHNSGTPILRIRKTFALRDTSRYPNRYDLSVTIELENPTEREQTVILTQGGAVGVRQEDPRVDYRTLFIGTFNAGAVHCSAGERAQDIDKEKPVYKNAPDAPPLMWTAVDNKYFVAFESFGSSPWTLGTDQPLQNVRGSSASAVDGDWIREIWQVPLTIDPQNGNTVTFRATTKPILIPASGRRTFEMDCYLGPKSRKAFQEVADYVERGYDSQVLASYASGPCSFMAFKPLTALMVNLLNWLHAVVFNYGVAIIMLVLVVRTILHPVTKKGQVNMMRMQQEMGSLQPKMEELKKRCGNDKAKYNQEVMKLYQEAGINPATQMFSSCLPMLLQMPIWIALYTSLNFNIDMRHQPFCLWIRDLTAPDALVEFSKPITLPLIGAMMGPIHSFNLLPILVSVAMFAQQKLMPKPKPASGQSTAQSEQAAQMQKMMPYMTIVFGFFFYNMPSGLNLYIGASSFFGTLEQWRIRKHIEMLKKQPPPVRDKTSEGSDVKRKGLLKMPSFFQRLQKAAAEAQKLKSNKPKKHKKT